MKNILMNSLVKSVVVTLLFAMSYIFYNYELVRSNIEDIAFDTVDKFIIAKKAQTTKGPKVLLFAMDDVYLKTNALLDEDNETNYGFFLPNDKIAEFIENLDEFVDDVEPENKPKLLFIDFDFKFTTAEYGKKLNPGDKKLIEVLEKERPYRILLPKTSKYNFIEHLQNPNIQRKIKEGKLIFVSVSLLRSEDGMSRRYLSYKSFKDANSTKTYINVAIAAKQLIENGDLNTSLAKRNFLKNDVIANRVWLKEYRNRIEEKNCISMQSFWTNYTKYSASCNLYDLDEDDFSNAIMLLGTTYSSSDDIFDTMDVLGSESFYGVEMHANAIETLFHLQGQLKRLGFMQSLILIFTVFFALSVFIAYVFKRINIENEEVEFLIVLAVVTAVLIAISIYLLQVYRLWFNWFVPLILYELIEVFEYLREFIPKMIAKIHTKKEK